MGGYNSLPQLQMPESPLQQAGQALSVKAMLDQNKLREQQTVAAGQENQQRQIQLDDQKKVRQAYLESNGDLEKTIEGAAKLWVSPQTLIGLKNTVIEQKQKFATLTKDELANQKTSSELIANETNAVLALPPAERPAAYAKAVQRMVDRGVMKPEAAQQALAHGYPGDDDLQVIGMSAMNAKDQAEARLKSAEMPGKQAESAQKELSTTAQQLANAPDKNAYNAIFQNLPVRIAMNFPDPSKWSPDARQQILQAGMTPHEQSTVPVDKIEMQSWLAQNAGKTPADYERWKAGGTTTASDSLGITSVSSKSLPPVSAGSPRVGSGPAPKVNGEQTRENLVEMIGTYRLNPTMLSRLMLKHPEVLAEVQQKYPEWDQTTYNAKNKEVSYMTSGKGGQQLTAFNTAITHLGTLERLSGDLGNGDIRIFNKAAQEFAKQTGSPAPANFAAAKNAMAGEVASALKASGATDQEIGKVSDTFDSAQSPQQLKGAISTYRELLNGKRDQLRKQYEGGKEGKPNFGDEKQGAPTHRYNPATGKIEELK